MTALHLAATRIAQIFYRTEVENLDFTPSHECEELRFFTAEEARREKIFPTVIAFLEIFCMEDF